MVLITDPYVEVDNSDIDPTSTQDWLIEEMRSYMTTLGMSEKQQAVEVHRYREGRDPLDARLGPESTKMTVLEAREKIMVACAEKGVDVVIEIKGQTMLITIGCNTRYASVNDVDDVIGRLR